MTEGVAGARREALLLTLAAWLASPPVFFRLGDRTTLLGDVDPNAKEGEGLLDL